MMRVPFRSILFLLPLAAFAAAEPEQLGFDPTTSNGLEQVASIYIAPENELFYRMRFPDGHYREFENRDAFSERPVQNLWGPDGWTGYLKRKEGLIFVESSSSVVGGRALFLFKNGRIIQFEQNGKVFKFPYEASRSVTRGGAPSYFQASEKELQEMEKRWLGSEHFQVMQSFLYESKKGWPESERIARRFDMLHIDNNGKVDIVLDLRDNDSEKR